MSMRTWEKGDTVMRRNGKGKGFTVIIPPIAYGAVVKSNKTGKLYVKTVGNYCPLIGVTEADLQAIDDNYNRYHKLLHGNFDKKKISWS